MSIRFVDMRAPSYLLQHLILRGLLRARPLSLVSLKLLTTSQASKAFKLPGYAVSVCRKIAKSSGMPREGIEEPTAYICERQRRISYLYSLHMAVLRFARVRGVLAP